MCFCQNTPLQTFTVQFVMYVQCAQHCCKTRCVSVRTHRYRPSQYNLLCTFSVHNISVTHNVLLSQHIVTHRHSTVIQTFISWQLYIINLTIPPRWNLHVQPCINSPTVGSYFVFYVGNYNLFSHNLQVFGFCTVAALLASSLVLTTRSCRI